MHLSFSGKALNCGRNMGLEIRFSGKFNLHRVRKKQQQKEPRTSLQEIKNLLNSQ